MSPRYACYRRPGFQRLFDDSSLLFDRSPPSHFSLGCLIKDGLLGCVHLFLVDTYRCAHIGQHPYLLSLRPDGSHQSLTVNEWWRTQFSAEQRLRNTVLLGLRGLQNEGAVLAA